MYTRQLSDTYISYNQFSEKMRSLHVGCPVALHELLGKSSIKGGMSLHAFDTRYSVLFLWSSYRDYSHKACSKNDNYIV